MAVPEQTPYREHTGNGVTKSFALGFICESKDHLIVLMDELEPPIATWSLSGGNVVFTTAPAAGQKITLQRNTPFGRTTDYQSFNNSFRPQTVNSDFDRLWLKLQELGVADWILSNRINDLRAYVDKQDNVLQDNIDSLKNYVDDKDDELRNYLLSAIQEQGVALDQLEEYYSYLMQQLAQVAIDRGWAASFIVSADGSTQQEINDFGGAKWWPKPLGYNLGATVKLENGDIVQSTVDGNTNNPNLGMTGWVDTNDASHIKYSLPSFYGKRVLSQKLSEIKSIHDYLIAGENYTDENFDWSPVFARALTSLKGTGGSISVPVKSTPYRLNGILQPDGQIVGIQMPYTGGSDQSATSKSINLVGESAEVLLNAGSDNMIVIRHSCSFSELGRFKIKYNGKIGCTALSLTPENWLAPHRFSQQSHNFIHDITTHGMRMTLQMACGGDGGTYYNLLQNIYHVGLIGYGGRGFGLMSWLGTSGPVNVKSPVNRNVFINCKAFFCNQGFYIEAGDTNRFYGCSVEGAIHEGEFEDVPTGLRILENDPVSGASNQLNKFYGFETEACVRDAVIDTSRIKIYGHNLDARKTILNPGAVTSSDIVGGADLTTFPNITGGKVTGTYLFPQNWSSEMSQFGETNYLNQFESDVGHKHKKYDILLSETSGVAAIGKQSAYYNKSARYVDMTVRFNFQSITVSNDIVIPLPFNANFAEYMSEINDLGGLRFPISINDGVGIKLANAQFKLDDAGNVAYLRIVASGFQWNTSGLFNQIHISLRYST